MPELPEEMYCSQQICIPPVFPYLLRQYAKAAIRTQPTDLLKWSTAYFRCLALNLPPPVKPRLEYPIPLDYNGLTPGWLKALVHQMPNAQSVSFKLLWDRWMGACLKHKNLIEILLLGRFQDNKAIPWWKFIALCAGHLTENLTHTMIMVCEILTEEPEGGSAMIPVKDFMDIYRFLADIDASRPQHLPNIHFTDSVLGLYEKVESEKSIPTYISSEHIVEVAEIELVEEEAISLKAEDSGSIVESCPDIASEEKPDEPLDQTEFQPKGTEVLPDSIDKTFALDKDKDEGEDKDGGEDKDEGEEKDQGDKDEMDNVGVIVNDEEVNEDNKQQEKNEENAKKYGEKKLDEPTEESTDKEEQKSLTEDESNRSESISRYGGDLEEDKIEGEAKANQLDKPESPLSAEDQDAISSPPISKEDMMSDVESGSDGKKKKKVEMEVVEDVEVNKSVDTVQEDTTGRFGSGEFKERKALPEHQVSGEEVADGAEESDLQVAKQALDHKEDVDMQQEDNHTGQTAEDIFIDNNTSFMSDYGEEEGEGGGLEEEVTMNLPRYEWFDIPAVPGIGPTVPIELVTIVYEYMTKMAKIQHGVVMPRNIRHFACPPLEVFDYSEE